MSEAGNSLPAIPEPNVRFLDNKTPTIHWNGKEYPVPLLTPKQQRWIIPALMRSRNAIMKLAQGNGPALTDAEYDDLVSVVYWSLKRAHPDLVFASFEDTPLSLLDLGPMIEVAAQQTGMFKKEAGNGAAVGEAQAAPAPNPQTGTQ